MMFIKVFNLTQLPQRPWKNGQGVTTEIAIDPPSARFPEDAFSWRLSCAEVSRSGPFSKFENYQRLLTIWQGAGIFMNDRPLRLFEIGAFSGDDDILCELMKGPVKDLGLIYDPKICRAEFLLLKMSQGESSVINENLDFVFVFCAGGEIMINNQKVSSSEVAQIFPEATNEVDSDHASESKKPISRLIDIRANQQAQLILVKIQKI